MLYRPGMPKDDGLTKLQFEVPKELLVRFKTVATGLQLTGAEAVAAAMTEWIDANKKKAGLR